MYCGSHDSHDSHGSHGSHGSPLGSHGSLARRFIKLDAKGRSTYRGLVPKRVAGPTEGVGAWTVATETATKARLSIPSHTGGNRWSKVRGQDRRKKRGEGRGENMQEQPGKTTVTRTKRARKRAYQATRPPARASGEGEVESSRGLGAASLNINFCIEFSNLSNWKEEA